MTSDVRNDDDDDGQSNRFLIVPKVGTEVVHDPYVLVQRVPFRRFPERCDRVKSLAVVSSNDGSGSLLDQAGRVERDLVPFHPVSFFKTKDGAGSLSVQLEVD